MAFVFWCKKRGLFQGSMNFEKDKSFAEAQNFIYYQIKHEEESKLFYF